MAGFDGEDQCAFPEIAVAVPQALLVFAPFCIGEHELLTKPDVKLSRVEHSLQPTCCAPCAACKDIDTNA